MVSLQFVVLCCLSMWLLVAYGNAATNVSGCSATFSVPLAETLTAQMASIGNIPDYAYASNLFAFTYYRISSVELSRNSDLAINVALAGGTANTTFTVFDKGPTLLSLLTANGIGHTYASIYDRYLSFGQFSDAKTQAKTIFDQLSTSTFQKSGGSQVLGGGKFLVSVKDRLVGSLLVPADYIDISSDYDSEEGHGLAEVISRNYGRIDVAATPSFISITLRSFYSYRIANDEYVYINFFNNFSEPEGCIANIPLVLHITSYQNTLVSQVASFASFVILVVGLVMVVGGSSVPTSHHAGAVGMLITTRFAHEDGQALSFVLSPLQASVGNDKYQFVIGALIANVGLIILVLIVQLIVVTFLKKELYLPRREAAGIARWPSISIAFFAHFAPQIFFLLGRLLGRIDTASILIASAVVILMAASVVAMAKKVLSTNETFGAVLDYSNANSVKYRKELSGYDRKRAEDSRADAFESHNAFQMNKDPLLSHMPVFGGMFKSTGEWIERRPADFLIDRWGFLFAHYRKKHWLIIEFADAMICGLISVLDNYTSPLAMYQYGIFSASKLCVLILVIVMRPALKSLHTSMMVFSYVGQLLASVALFVGSIRAETLDIFTTLKDVILVFVDFMLALHILLVLFESIRSFYRRVRLTDERRKEFEEERERHAYVVETLEKEAEEFDIQLETVRSRSRSMVMSGELERGGEGSNSGNALTTNSSSEVKKKSSKTRRALPEFGFEQVQSNLFDVLVEGQLPGSLMARQVESRNIKFDSRNLLPAQEAIRINADGSVTFLGDMDEVHQDGQTRKRLRELKTAQGTIMIEPVYATWGLDDDLVDDGSSIGNNNNNYDAMTDTGSRIGGSSKKASSHRGTSSRGGRSRSASRYSKGSRGILGVGKGFKDSNTSSSEEDSDSAYDSEGLPVISVEQKAKKQKRRDERTRRKQEKLLWRQGAMDADGDYLLDDCDLVDGDGGDLLGGTVTSLRRFEGSSRSLNALRSVSPSSPQLQLSQKMSASLGHVPSLSLYGAGAKFTSGRLVAQPTDTSITTSRLHNLSRSGFGTNTGGTFGLTLEAIQGLSTLQPGQEAEEKEKEERLKYKKEKREQRQLAKGIVTSTANLCRHIPNGGVTIQQFFSFVDSVPTLSLEEKAKHKRRLAEKIRTIYRDKARENANKRKQEKINASLRLEGGGEYNNGGLQQIAADSYQSAFGSIPNDKTFVSKIIESLKKGGIRGEPFGTSLDKKKGSAQASGKRSYNYQPYLLGYLTNSSSSSSSQDSDDEDAASAAESELMSALLGHKSARSTSKSDADGNDNDSAGATSVGGRSYMSRGAKSGKSAKSKMSAATSVARSGLGSIRVPSSATGCSPVIKASGSKKKRKVFDDDMLGTREQRNISGQPVGGPSDDDGHINHDWLILDDEVQNAAAHYTTRALDTYEAAAVARDTALMMNIHHRGAMTSAIEMSSSPHQKLDAAVQRRARQSGTLIAVWESIAKKAGDKSGQTATANSSGAGAREQEKEILKGFRGV